MSDVTDSVGGYELFEVEGQAWQLSHLTPGIRAAFCSWCKMRARKEITGRQAYLSPAEYRDDLKAFNEQVGAGDYNWSSPFDPRRMGSAIAATLDEDEGRVHITGLMLEPHHGKLPAEKVVSLILGGGADFTLAWRIAMGLPLEPADPNPKAPEKPGTTPAA